MTETNIIYNSECLEGLKKLPDNSVHCCATSPPYYGLRDYGVDGQLGLEDTPEEFVLIMVLIFTEVKRVLRADGTLWLNLGDSYGGSGKGAATHPETNEFYKQRTNAGTHNITIHNYRSDKIKPKDLMGIPWMVAFALRNSGWYLRQDIIWSKPNPMPESVKDRCTKSHEYIFLLSKSKKYYYDHEAIKEKASNNTHARQSRAKMNQKSSPDKMKNGIRPPKSIGVPSGIIKNNESFNAALTHVVDKRNKRSVWNVSPENFPEAHFATFPQKLIEDCIKAGCPEGGIVLDPFMGAGTTAVVARKLNRNYIGFELNPEYIEIAERRLSKELGIFN